MARHSVPFIAIKDLTPMTLNGGIGSIVRKIDLTVDYWTCGLFARHTRYHLVFWETPIPWTSGVAGSKIQDTDAEPERPRTHGWTHTITEIRWYPSNLVTGTDTWGDVLEPGTTH